MLSGFTDEDDASRPPAVAALRRRCRAVLHQFAEAELTPSAAEMRQFSASARRSPQVYNVEVVRHCLEIIGVSLPIAQWAQLMIRLRSCSFEEMEAPPEAAQLQGPEAEPLPAEHALVAAPPQFDYDQLSR